MTTIKKHSVVSIHYTLKDDSGAILDSTRLSGKPLTYVQGTDNLLSGLEAELEGKHAGHFMRVVIPPEKGFGVINPALMQIVSVELFDGMNLQPGMVFDSQSDNHQIRTVKEIKNGMVTLDANHPLAGKNLHFDVEIVFVRTATSNEIERGLF